MEAEGAKRTGRGRRGDGHHVGMKPHLRVNTHAFKQPSESRTGTDPFRKEKKETHKAWEHERRRSGLLGGRDDDFWNTCTHPGEQERSLVGADLKRLIGKRRASEVSIALTADARDEDRQIPVHPADWYLLCSRLTSVRTLSGHIRKCSTSDVWSRVASAVGPLVQCSIGSYCDLVDGDFHKLVARTSDQPFSYSAMSLDVSFLSAISK